MSEDQSPERTAFERWAEKQQYSTLRWPSGPSWFGAGKYRDRYVQLAWEAWQAAQCEMQKGGCRHDEN